MATHVWRILHHKESLWVKWVHVYHLKDKSFWEVPIKPDVSWSWRKILMTRNVIHKHFFHKIGNGQDSLAWFDVWDVAGPLFNFVSWRDINGAEFHPYSKVGDITLNEQWSWPIFWYHKYPQLLQIHVPVLTDTHDSIKWRGVDGSLSDFSVATSYEDIRSRAVKVNWFRVIWFTQSIPRHAFVAWLLMREKLKTHDKMKAWEVHNQVLLCPLCKLCPDSHAHLFFDCCYSREVWDKVQQMMLNMSSSYDWQLVSNELANVSINSASGVVAKLMFAASVYFIWQERNDRLFKGKVRLKDRLFEDIYSTVRMKIMTVRFKDSRQVRQIKIAWKLN
ncbi:uncharacterized protein [Rutidosis leptorrhynchoides]|uniref:uncharacterized protein n=1 Tax=Rutidosis leptorrhynchoides TaxID=125765 RepID=UPI003A99F45C